MRYQRTALLASIATLALVAGTGFASAQQAEGKGATPKGAPHAAQPMNKAPAAGQGRTEANPAQHTERAPAPQNPKSAEESNRTNKADKTKAGENGAAQRNETKAGSSAEERNRAGEHNAAERDHNPRSAQDRDRDGRENAAQRGRNRMEGLQGNASGVNVRLNDEQRTQIRNTVINVAGAPRVASVDFDITVGTVIPRGGIRIVPVPEMLVRIEPEWQGFLYFVYEDEVVIVNPRDMRIVAVVAV
jgi:hypothetical protein